jgi:hypothetical protein
LTFFFVFLFHFELISFLDVLHDDFLFDCGIGNWRCFSHRLISEFISLPNSIRLGRMERTLIAGMLCRTIVQASPYLGMPQLSSPYSHYTMSASPMLQVVSPAEAAVNSQLGVVAAAQAGGAGVGGYHGAPANKLQRSDRIEVRKKNQKSKLQSHFY